MIKRGISGILLCFFCCVQCFPVFAQEIEQEIIIKEDGENSIIQNTQENSVDSSESTSSFDGEDKSPDVEDGTQEEEIPNEIADDGSEFENADSGDESSENSESDSEENGNEDDENPDENLDNSTESEIPSEGEDNPDNGVETPENGEGNSDENSDENNQETPEIVFSDIFIDFQNPSYILEKDIQKQEYFCDPEREECKVNIKILDENQSEISSDFGCEVIFSTGDEFTDCNPTSIVFEESENTINIKLFEENNLENFIEKEIIILKNNISEDDSTENGEDNSENGEDNSENGGDNSGGNGNEDNENPDENPDNSPESESPSEGEDGIPDENNEETPKIVFPEIFIDFQNPSYILEKDIQKEEYFCDPEKEECKINIKILDETQSEISSDFGCEIFFSNGEEFIDCNPTSVIFEESENTINIKIFEVNNGENFIEKEIIILKNNIPEDDSTENGEDNSGQNGSEDGENPDENPANPTGPESPSEGEDNPDTSTGSGTTQNETGGDNAQENPDNIEEILLPEIFIDFQNPSYILDKEIQKEEYFCDPEKEECKINIKILDETQSEISSDFGCEIFFSNGEEFIDCNPTSIVFEESENTINIKIFEVNNGENFYEKEIIIVKNTQDGTDNSDDTSNSEDSGASNNDNVTASGSVSGNENSETTTGTGNIQNNEENDNSGNDSEENPENIEDILLPEIILEVQSGANLQGDILYCDKNDCSLNLNLEENFGNNFDASDFGCDWDFSQGIFSSQNTDKKCNPGYVKYGIGKFELSVKIYQKNKETNFIKKIFIIQNPKKVTKKSGRKSSGNTQGDMKNIENITLNKEIIIQSGAENNTCNSEKCSLNLQYKNASYEECIWDFGVLESRDKYTKTCNPRNIYLPAGGHKISLHVQNNKTQTQHEKILFITNIYEPIKTAEMYNFEIILQGKPTEFRKKLGNDIVCLGVEKCNINLTTKYFKNLEYKWIFPGDIIIEKNNPTGEWFGSGAHNITLEIYKNTEKIFEKNITVQVVPPEDKEDIVHIAEKIEAFESTQNNFLGSLKNLEIDGSNISHIRNTSKEKVKNILSNTQKSFSSQISKIDYFEDASEKSRIKLTRNISQQKKALKFSGKTFPNSTVYIDDGEKIFLLSSDEKGKYEWKQQSNIKSGNFVVDYYVIDEFGNYFQTNNYKNVSISDEYIGELAQNIQKKSKKSSQKKKKKKISGTQEDKIKNVDVEKEINYASIGGISTNKMTFGQKFLWMGICLIGFLGLFFIGRKYKIV